MLGPAARSPATRGITDLQERVSRLEAFSRWREPIRLDYEALIGKSAWDAYLQHLDVAVKHLSDAHKLGRELAAITSAARKSRASR